jgi:hypothetical protein
VSGERFNPVLDILERWALRSCRHPVWFVGFQLVHPKELWYAWDQAGMPLTKVGPISSAAYADEEFEPDRHQQRIRKSSSTSAATLYHGQPSLRFKQLAGVLPLEYLMRWRMQSARDALRRKEL